MRKTLDELSRELGGRYAVVVVVAKRAKQIKEAEREGRPRPALVETKSKRAVVIALEELAAGKVVLREPSEDDDADIQVVDRVAVQPGGVDDLLGEALAAQVRAASAAAADDEASSGDAEESELPDGDGEEGKG